VIEMSKLSTYSPGELDVKTVPKWKKFPTKGSLLESDEHSVLNN